MSDASMKEECLAQGRYLSLVKKGRWEYAHRHGALGAACIVALTAAGELVLVEQYRVPLGRACIELPAGLAGDDGAAEALETAARRELLEETGFAAALWRYVAAPASSAGLTDEAPAIFLATGLTRVHAGGGDGDEAITVHLVPLDTLADWLADKAAQGFAIDIKVYAAPWLISVHGV